MSYTLKSCNEAVNNFCPFMGDYVSASRSIYTNTVIPLIGITSHCFNMAVNNIMYGDENCCEVVYIGSRCTFTTIHIIGTKTMQYNMLMIKI